MVPESYAPSSLPAFLGRFLSNPSPIHHRAANRVLAYLRDTRSFFLNFSNRPSFQAYADTSYTDNHDHSSSAGYIFTFAGAPVDWKSYKQRPITLSTTESELFNNCVPKVNLVATFTVIPFC